MANILPDCADLELPEGLTFAQKMFHLKYLPLFKFTVQSLPTSMALKEYPMLNAHYDVEANELIWRASHNLGVAVATPNGLVVPNIKDVEQKNILEIAEDLNRLTEAAKQQQLKQQDLTGGTFTLSNIGSIGGTYTSPVLFLPEVAIGALGKILRVPRFVSPKSDQVQSVHLMNVSWSADHRVVDGATMASFSNLFKSYLENPGLMALKSV